jgi:hypothetical protein
VKKKSRRPPNAVEEVHEPLGLPINFEGTSSALAAMADADSMGNNYVHKYKITKWSEGDARIKRSRRLLTGKIKQGNERRHEF